MLPAIGASPKRRICWEPPWQRASRQKERSSCCEKERRCFASNEAKGRRESNKPWPESSSTLRRCSLYINDLSGAAVGQGKLDCSGGSGEGDFVVDRDRDARCFVVHQEASIEAGHLTFGRGHTLVGDGER